MRVRIPPRARTSCRAGVRLGALRRQRGLDAGDDTGKLLRERDDRLLVPFSLDACLGAAVGVAEMVDDGLHREGPGAVHPRGTFGVERPDGCERGGAERARRDERVGALGISFHGPLDLHAAPGPVGLTDKRALEGGELPAVLRAQPKPSASVAEREVGGVEVGVDDRSLLDVLAAEEADRVG